MEISHKNELIYEKDRITDGFNIFYWVFNDKSSFNASHWHRAIEIMYIIKGEVEITSNSETTLLTAGDIYLVDSFAIHSTRSVKGNVAILVQLPYSILKKYIKEFDYLNFSFNPHKLTLSEKKDVDRLINIILEMKYIFENKIKGGKIKFEGLVYQMLYILYTDFAYSIPVDKIKKEQKNLERLKLVMEYTNANYKTPITIDEISEIACFQKEYFCNFFKRNTGLTYLEYLNQIRISKIYRDLLNTDLTLKAILEKNGFTNYKLFRRMFFEQFHTTPAQFRKKNKE